MSSNTDGAVKVALDLRLIGYRGGGIARYGAQLHRALQAQPVVEVTALRAWSDTTADARSCRLRTPPHHRLEQVAIPVEMALRRARAHVYHAIDFIAPRFPRLPTVATVHDLAFRHWPGDLAPDALAYYQRLARARHWTDAWITPSEWTANELAEMYAVERSRIHVIPHGESLGLLKEPPLLRAARGDYVLAVGTVEPRKRYDLLLAALALAGTEVRLVIAGRPGWQSAETERQIQRAPNVAWHAHVDDAALRRLYREAVAVVVPSRAEGFGLPALEAMAAGTPVLSSGGGALPEVTGMAALEVGDGTAESWAAAIERVGADDELWESLSRAGRLEAQRFDWDMAASATAAVYLTLGGN